MEYEKYIEEKSMIKHAKNFSNTLKEKINTSAISTGFSNLDDYLNGGLYEGLYCIGAISSLGKTTFVLQIADNIARNGNHVLFFSLEMAKYELMTKSISRYTFLDDMNTKRDPLKDTLAMSTRDLTDGEKYNSYKDTDSKKMLIDKSAKQYSEIANNIFIFDGEDINTINHANNNKKIDYNIGYNIQKIGEIVENHMKITEKTKQKPVVIIDYLQIIPPENQYGTDKQNTDKAITGLKAISRIYKIPLIAISSLNRGSYKASVNMSGFKESGAIEYSSDVLIGLQPPGVDKEKFDIDTYKDSKIRNVELKILKNRNGVTGKTIEYNYYPKYNYFKEN